LALVITVMVRSPLRLAENAADDRYRPIPSAKGSIYPGYRSPVWNGRDLKLLRTFAVLAEEQHFGRAARRLGVSQRPLSLATHKLEAELGTSLFERTNRRVAMIQVGVVLQREARAISIAACRNWWPRCASGCRMSSWSCAR
jgi:hypothetical protein